MLDSPMTTYSDTTPQHRVITDAIAIIDPSETPFIPGVGGLDGAAGKFKFVGGKSTTVEWLEDTLAALTDQLNGSIASGATTITVDDASKFRIGHIIQIDLEQMWVSASVIATEVITVTRNYSGTQATHADDAAVEIIGVARVEGADADVSAFRDRTSGSNYTQIFQEEVKVTRTQSQISQYGIADEFEYQSNKRLPELMRLVEKQSYRGARKAGSASAPRGFGGLGTFITDNLVAGGSGTLTEAMFKSALRASADDGGMGPWTAWLSSENMEDVSSFLDSSSFLRVSLDDKVIGMVIEQVRTPFGVCNLVYDRWAPESTVFITDNKNIGFLEFSPFTRALLAKTGDSMKGEVVGEYTLCVRLDKSHAAITAVVT